MAKYKILQSAITELGNYEVEKAETYYEVRRTKGSLVWTSRYHTIDDVIHALNYEIRKADKMETTNAQ